MEVGAKCQGNAGECKRMPGEHMGVGAVSGECRRMPGEGIGMCAKCQENAGECMGVGAMCQGNAGECQGKIRERVQGECRGMQGNARET